MMTKNVSQIRSTLTTFAQVLQIFPRSSIKTGRAKRNATFPGGISTTYMAQYSGTALQTPPVKCSDNVSPAEEVPESLPSERSPSCNTKGMSMLCMMAARSSGPVHRGISSSRITE